MWILKLTLQKQRYIIITSVQVSQNIYFSLLRNNKIQTRSQTRRLLQQQLERNNSSSENEEAAERRQGAPLQVIQGSPHNIDQEGFYLIDQLKQKNRKFRLACNQVVLLNNEIEYQHNRYDLAVQDMRRSLRFYLRLNIAICEETRNMFSEYVHRKADELDALHGRLVRDGVLQEELDLSVVNGEDQEEMPWRRLKHFQFILTIISLSTMFIDILS